jgi:hypothetical protein
LESLPDGHVVVHDQEPGHLAPVPVQGRSNVVSIVSPFSSLSVWLGKPPLPLVAVWAAVPGWGVTGLYSDAFLSTRTD